MNTLPDLLAGSGSAVGLSLGKSVLPQETDAHTHAPSSDGAKHSCGNAADTGCMTLDNSQSSFPCSERFSNESADFVNHNECLNGEVAAGSCLDSQLKRLTSNSVVDCLQLESAGSDLGIYDLGVYVDVFNSLQAGAECGWFNKECTTSQEAKRQENSTVGAQRKSHGHPSLNQSHSAVGQYEQGVENANMSETAGNPFNTAAGRLHGVHAAGSGEEADESTLEDLESLLFPDSNPEMSMKVYEHTIQRLTGAVCEPVVASREVPEADCSTRKVDRNQSTGGWRKDSKEMEIAAEGLRENDAPLDKPNVQHMMKMVDQHNKDGDQNVVKGNTATPHHNSPSGIQYAPAELVGRIWALLMQCKQHYHFHR